MTITPDGLLLVVAGLCALWAGIGIHFCLMQDSCQTRLCVDNDEQLAYFTKAIRGIVILPPLVILTTIVAKVTFLSQYG